MADGGFASSRSPTMNFGGVGEYVVMQWMEEVTFMHMNATIHTLKDFKDLSTGVHFTAVLEQLYSNLTYTVNRKNSSLETLSERFAFIREKLVVTYGDYVESIINISACRLGDTDALMNVSLLLLCALTNAIIHRRKHCEHTLYRLYGLKRVVQQRIKTCIEEWLKSDNDKMGIALARMKNILRMEFQAAEPSSKNHKRKSVKQSPPLQEYLDSEEIKQELILRENRHLQLINAEKPPAITREIPAAAVCEPSSSGSKHMVDFCSTDETGQSFIMQTFPRPNRQLQMPELSPAKIDMPSLICESSPFGSKRKRSYLFQDPEEVQSSEKDARIKELEKLVEESEQQLKQKEQIIVKLNIEKRNLQSEGNLFQLKFEEISRSQEDKSAYNKFSLEKELQETRLELEKYKQATPKKSSGNKVHAAEIKKLKLAHESQLLNTTMESKSKIKALELEKECLQKELEKVTDMYGSSVKSVKDFNEEQERRLTLQLQVYEEKITKLTNKLQIYEEKFGSSTSQLKMPSESSGHEEKQITEGLPRTDNNFQLKTEECDPVLQASCETVAQIMEKVECVNRECNLRIAKYEEEKNRSDILISQYQEKIASCQAEYEDKLKEYQEQIVKHEEELKSSDVLIAEQKEKIKNFEEQITEMKDKCKDFDNRVLNYEKRIQISDAKVEECISAAASEKKKHDKIIENLKSELAQAKVNIEDKVADYEEKIKVSDEINMECSSAAELAKQKHEEEIANFEALLAETKEDAKHFKQLVAEDEVKIKSLNAKVEDYQRVKSQLDSQIAQYKKRVTEWELQHAKGSEKLLKLSQLEGKIEELNNQNKKLVQQVKDHQASDTKAAAVLKELKDVHKTEVAGLSNRISQLETEINKKNTDLLQEGKKYKECKDELEYTGKLLTEAKKEKTQREQELTAIRQARIKEKDERSLELTSLKENSDKMKRTLQEKIENLTNENEVFRRQMEIKNAQMEEKEALQLEKEGALKKIEELQCTYAQDINKLSVEIENLQNELSDTKFSLQEQLRIHTGEKSKMEKEKEDLLIDMKKMREDSSMEIEMLQGKLSDSLEEQLKIHTSEKTKLEKENRDLLKKIRDDSNTEIEKLQGELSEKTRLYEELRNTASPERVAELQKKYSLLVKKHHGVEKIAANRRNMIKKYCEVSSQSKKELMDYKKKVAATISRKVASEVQDKTSTFKTEVAALQEKLRSRDREVESLKANIESATKDFEREMARMKSEHEEQVDFLKHERNILKRDIKELKCSIHEEKQEFIMSLRQTISDLKDRLYSNEELRIETRKKHEAERQEDFAINEKLRQEITKVKDELKFYEEHNDLTGLKELQDKINKLEVEKGKLIDQIQFKEKINKKLRLHNNHFQNQEERMNELKEELEKELIIAKAKCAALPSTDSEEQKREPKQRKNLRKFVSVAGRSDKPNPSRMKSVHCQSQNECSLGCLCRKKYPFTMRARPQLKQKMELKQKAKLQQKAKKLKQKTKLKQKKFKNLYNIDFDFLVETALEVETTPEIRKHFYFPAE